ncbi:MAG: hypothetical protein LBD49_01760 [Oscillospiraceae bacterium]|nr:hypothetical protein [Oscillospiraceae bacterium]
MSQKPNLPLALFGRRGSRHMLVPRGDTLWLALAPEGAPSMVPTAPRPAGLFEILVLAEGKPTPYTYSADVAALEIKAPGGGARVTHDAPIRALRVECEGVSIRFDAKSPAGVSSLNTPDGPVVNIGGGRYVFSARRGKITFDDTWMLASFGSVTPVVDVAPVGGIIDLVVYELPGDTPLPAVTRTFDECAEGNAAEYAAFAKSMVTASTRASALRDAAAYSLWLNSKELPGGKHCVTPDRITSQASSPSWQALASLAFRDFGAVFELLMSLPEASPPLHGLAVTRLLDDGLTGGADAVKLRELYFALEKTAAWWRDNRTLPGSELSFYAYRFETGHPNPSYFTVGAPVIAPDLNAYLVLLYDALGRLAAGFGDKETSAKYAGRAEARLAAMLDTLWDGERFFAVNAYSGERAEPDGKTCCAPFTLNETPVILGGRLPEDVLSKLADKIDAENRFGLGYLTLLSGLASYPGAREKAKKLTLELLRDAEERTDPVYGAALLALASKAI